MAVTYKVECTHCRRYYDNSKQEDGLCQKQDCLESRLNKFLRRQKHQKLIEKVKEWFKNAIHSPSSQKGNPVL